MKTSARCALFVLGLCLGPAAMAAVIPFGGPGFQYLITSGQAAAPLPGGGYAVVWAWTLSGGPYSDADVRMQWVRPDGSLVFAKAGLVVAGSTQEVEAQAVVVPHPESGVFVAYVRGDDEVKTQVLVQRYDGNGRRLWPGIGVPALVEPGRRNQLLPTLVPDAEGGVYVCFASLPVDGVAQSSSILCQHLNANGKRLWSQKGREAGGALGLRNQPRALPDGHGGLLVFWRNDRMPDTAPSLRVLIEGQHFSPDGSRLWGRRGQLIQRTHVPGQGIFFGPYPYYLQAVPDGKGGAILGFQDRLSATSDILDVGAQRVDGDGHVLWGAGTAVASGSDPQILEHLIAGPAGEAFAVVLELRGKAGAGLVVHRLGSDGSLLWSVPAVAPEVEPVPQHFTAFGVFAGGLLRIAWGRILVPNPVSAEGRLLVLDLDGNRLNGPEGEALTGRVTVPYFARGFVYDEDLGQGFVAWSPNQDHAAGEIVDQ